MTCDEMGGSAWSADIGAGKIVMLKRLQVSARCPAREAMRGSKYFRRFSSWVSISKDAAYHPTSPSSPTSPPPYPLTGRKIANAGPFVPLKTAPWLWEQRQFASALRAAEQAWHREAGL